MVYSCFWTPVEPPIMDYPREITSLYTEPLFGPTSVHFPIMLIHFDRQRVYKDTPNVDTVNTILWLPQ